MGGIGTWWDGVEQWLTGRPYVVQLIVVSVFFIPLAAGLAAGLNALVGKGFRVVDRMAERRDEGRAAAAVGAQETGEETS